MGLPPHQYVQTKEQQAYRETKGFSQGKFLACDNMPIIRPRGFPPNRSIRNRNLVLGLVMALSQNKKVDPALMRGIILPLLRNLAVVKLKFGKIKCKNKFYIYCFANGIQTTKRCLKISNNIPHLFACS